MYTKKRAKGEEKQRPEDESKENVKKKELSKEEIADEVIRQLVGVISKHGHKDEIDEEKLDIYNKLKDAV